MMKAYLRWLWLFPAKCELMFAVILVVILLIEGRALFGMPLR